MKLPLLARILLWPFSVLYGGYVRIRAWLYQNGWLKQKRLRGKVISVGNLTVGGTGKTPMVLWLAEKFLAEGKRVAILSRGYRGSGGTSDEIELMKHRLQDRVAFGVGKDRFAEGHRIEQKAANRRFPARRRLSASPAGTRSRHCDARRLRTNSRTSGCSPRESCANPYRLAAALTSWS